MTPPTAATALLLCSLAAAPTSPATVDVPGDSAPESSHGVRYRDGERWVIAERLPATGAVPRPVRLRYPARSWSDLLSIALDETRHFGSTSVQVSRRLRALLDGLPTWCPPTDDPQSRRSWRCWTRALPGHTATPQS